MEKLEKYKAYLGGEIARYLDGEISLSQLEDRVVEAGHATFQQDDDIRHVWHALYQYETDIDVDDRDYANSVTSRMRQISNALRQGDAQLTEHIDRYFNSP